MAIKELHGKETWANKLRQRKWAIKHKGKIDDILSKLGHTFDDYVKDFDKIVSD